MSEHETLNSENSIPFFPDHVRTEFRVVLGVMIIAGLIGGIAYFAPVGLGDPADPMQTPAHVKPEWYFLSLYQLLKYIPKTIGAVSPVLAVLLILLWPFIDRKPDGSTKPRRVRLLSAVAILVLLTALTIWGEVS